MLKSYKIDLHNHTVLSPCGGLEMSPRALLIRAQELGLDIIAITDHNSTKNCHAYCELGKEYGVVVICGIEIQTIEEVHIIALFATLDEAMKFDKQVSEALLPLNNNPDFFGDQVIVDKDENIIGIEERALINSVKWDFETTIAKIKQFEAICFPAHVDAKRNSVTSQLGFLPPDSKVDGIGITANCDIKTFLTKYSSFANNTIIRNSDAHYLKEMGSGSSFAKLKAPTFAELKKAFAREGGREIIPV